MTQVTRESLVAETRENMALAIKKRDAKAISASLELLRKLGEERPTEQDDAAIKLLAELDCIPTALYRHFSRDGALLYIGVSMTVTGRTAKHETYAPWFQQIDTIKLEWFGSRSSAMRAEKHAIKTEKPLHNVTHNKGTNNAAKEHAPRTVRSGTGKRRERQPSL